MNYLEIANFALAAATAIVAFYNWNKKQANKFLFILKEETNLYSSIAKDIDGLQINFNGEQISQSIYLVKAFFIYQGNDDITESSVKKPIYLETDKSNSFLSPKVLFTSKDLDVFIEHKENYSILFNTPLMKPGEFFYFQTLLDRRETVNTYLIPGHRIKDVPEIKKVNYYDVKNKKDNVIFWGFVVVATLIFRWFVFSESYNEAYVKWAKPIYTFDNTTILNRGLVFGDSTMLAIRDSIQQVVRAKELVLQKLSKEERQTLDLDKSKIFLIEESIKEGKRILEDSVKNAVEPTYSIDPVFSSKYSLFGISKFKVYYYSFTGMFVLFKTLFSALVAFCFIRLINSLIDWHRNKEILETLMIADKAVQRS